MKIGKTIASVRKEKGLKQYQLARMSGMSKSYLSEIENDYKTPDLNILEKISSALNVPINILIFKATNEEDVHEPEKKRFIKDIKPLMDKIIDELYGLENSQSIKDEPNYVDITKKLNLLVSTES